MIPDIKKRRKAIKSILLDQNLFACIGNWLADEILFQARLAPNHLASTLTSTQVRTLHAQTLKVVKTAVAAKAGYDQFTKSWLFHERWGKNPKAISKRGKIILEKIGGRTTAWVPGWQK